MTKNNCYVWEGVNASGKKLQGEIQALSSNLAKMNLIQQGISPLKIRRKLPFNFSLKNKKITARDTTLFFRQLATTLTAGIPLVEACGIIGHGQEKPKLRALIFEIKNELEKGNSLADTLKNYPRYFDNLLCHLLHAGEQSGTLEPMLQRLASYKEKMEILKRKIVKALIYPVSVIGIAIIVTCIMLIYIVPRFEELFNSFGKKLPYFTLQVIHLSQFLRAEFWLIFCSFLLLGFGLQWGVRRSTFIAERKDRFLLSIPLLGTFIKKTILARFARSLATTFGAGVTILDALKTIAPISGNHCYLQAITNLQLEIAAGQQLHFAMQKYSLFPNLLVQMIKVGEESGTLDKILDKTAEIYEADIDSVVDNLSTMLEPLILLVLGVLIGALVIAMYLPIFQLGSVF